MAVRKIDYLAWARRHMGRVRYDLAKSNIQAVTPEEIGLRAEHVRLARADEEGDPELHDLIARRYNVPVQNVLVTNGATQGIYLACNATVDRGDEALLESPNYEPLYRVLVHAGAQVKILERRFEHGFQIDLEDLERTISRSTRALVMTNLHNPSGVATNPERLRTLSRIASDHGAHVICSEVYLDSAFQEGHRPIATLGPRMISIGSLTKVYGLGGLRIGWILADPSVIERAKLILDYISGGHAAPSESLACLALRQADKLVDRCRRIVQGSLEILREWVSGRKDVQWIEPDGGTVCLLRLAPQIDPRRLSDLLREKYGTLVVPGDFFWLRGFIRVSCGVLPDILRAGLKNISKAMDELKSGR